jgi:asparagine synthase (glutamine-hydrolysing)
MCGIAGVWSPTGVGTAEAIDANVHAMCQMILHRGPDDLGTWSDGRVGLGYTRLAIIDLSEAAHQPMVDESGRVRLVFNGEMYNFREVRAELEAHGHRFRSTSDTEVVLRGYLEWGEEVLQRMRGMFAFAIWDANRDRLLLARDRIGQKPLNYAWHNGALLFGSEAKSILRWPGFERRPNLEDLPQYFMFRYFPATNTAFEGIHRLEPAHYMTVEGEGNVEIHRYWNLPEPGRYQIRDEQDLKDGLLAQLDEAVQLRMISDVPLGAFLSGGVDSSAVVASMAMASPEPIRTFTIGFREASGIDERRFAKMVADRYGTHHTEYVVDPDVEGVATSLAWHYGEPYADEVTIPTYCISAIARRDVTVALNGDGGDEAFFGYRRHAGSRMGGWLDHMPRTMRNAIGASGRLPLFKTNNRRLKNVGKAIAGASRTPLERYTDWVTYGSQELLDLMVDRFDWEVAHADAMERFRPFFAGNDSAADAAARADTMGLLNENLEVRVDIATMANGLEGRSPFLDHKLIEWAARVAPRQRMRRLELKYLLKQALLPRVPREVMYRPKQGLFMDFTFLLDHENFIRDTVLSPEAKGRGLLDPGRVEALLDRHYRGDHRYNAAVYMLFILEQWFQMWIDPPEIPLTPPPKPRLD